MKLRKIKTPEERIKNYGSMGMYFRTGERQRIENHVGRKTNSRDYIEAYKKQEGIK